MHRDSGPFVRLLLAALLAGAGALLVLAGLTSIVRPAPSASGSPGQSAAPAGSSSAPAGSPSASSSPAASAGSASAIATAPSDASPTPIPAEVTLLGAGDIGRCDGTGDEATAEMVAAREGIVFTLGDNAYEDGSEAEFRDCLDPSWGRFKERIELPVPGNHDHDTPDAAGYRAYFGDAAAPEGTTWYSRDVGAWHVVVLDSTCNAVDGGCGPDSPQVAWLRQDLAASRARCTLALFHHPRFSSGEHGSDGNVGPFWDTLYEAGADLVVNGHEHDYERFAPQDPQGRPDDARGIMQLVVGTGGAPLRNVGDPIENSRVRASVSHGIVVLRLNQTGWSWQFDTTDGAFRDAGSERCH